MKKFCQIPNTAASLKNLWLIVVYYFNVRSSIRKHTIFPTYIVKNKQNTETFNEL